MRSANSYFVSLFFILSLPILPSAAAGCAQSETRNSSTPALPFVVRVNSVSVQQRAVSAEHEIETERGDKEYAAKVATPARFGDVESLKRNLARSLADAGIFTEVTTDTDSPADLELDIVISGGDFGPGEPTVGGSVFSTIVWLTAGHFSWFIDNREYPESDVILSLNIRRPNVSREAGRSREEGEAFRNRTIYQEDLLLKGMQLNLLERADVGDWFLNIVLPPWWGDGDPERTGRSLGDKTVEFFGAQVPDHLAGRFPALHHSSLASFLVHDARNDSIIIIAQQRVRKLEIKDSEGRTHTLRPEDIELHEVQGNEIDAIRLYLSQRGMAVGAGRLDRYYEIPLARDQSGKIHVVATLARSTSSWTIDVKKRT